MGSGMFKSASSETDDARCRQSWDRRAEAIVKPVTHYEDPSIIAEVSKGLGEAMVGINLDTLPRRSC